MCGSEDYFFNENADKVAIALLGKVLCHKLSNGEVVRLRILETEAYNKEDGAICYGGEGNYPKNKSSMLYSVGQLCDYCEMLLISCTAKDRPDNVLIRAGEILDENGKLTDFEKPILLRDAFWSGETVTQIDLLTSKDIWIDDLNKPICSYCCHKRVNIISNRKWHFCLQE